MLPSAFEDYLEAILTITGDGKRPVALQEIADALDTERTVVEDTLTSLIEEGYLEQFRRCRQTDRERIHIGIAGGAETPRSPVLPDRDARRRCG